MYDIIHPVRHEQLLPDPPMNLEPDIKDAEVTPERGKATTFWILPANRRALKALSEETGTSVSYLINRAIARFLENPQSLFLSSCHTNHTPKSQGK